jgi:tetratricopeptide (TPR) repeat protein
MRNKTVAQFALISAFIAPQAIEAAPACQKPIAKVASAQGKVDVKTYGNLVWQSIHSKDSLCPGDALRTSRWSRATLNLVSGAVLTVDQNTTMSFSAPMPQESTDSWLISLLNGTLFSRSRQLQRLEINTPFINAVHKGTEFMVTVSNKQAEISVFDGQVSGENSTGKITINKGEKGIAEAGKPPRVQAIKVSPEDAVQWMLYYPPIIDGQQGKPADTNPNLSAALAAYRQGDINQALAKLDEIPASQQDAHYVTLKAALLLTVGRVDEAQPLIRQLPPDNGDALALQAIVAVAKNQQQAALDLATQAVAANPQSPTAKIAQSYAYQAQFKLDEALAATQEATKLNPDNALAWARLSELQLSQGDHDAALKSAQKAQTLNPKIARTQTILGFADLAQTDINAAKQAFEQALTLDSSDPLARLGLGLAKIRQGDLEEGKAELETAVNLDPNNAVTRSYLGKAYYELRNKDYAGKEFEIAKERDPKDPTPYFYDAILKQTTNRPVEALHDMQKAIELNDNRGVYRSKLLLDEDVAARSAAQGRIYSDLGFSQRALVEGWGSVSADPSNFSAHRFLADSYAALPRHQVARVSELLQSQLLQPINITPIQPHLAESNLLLLGGLGPSNFSFNEFNPLFQRNRLGLQASGFVGSNDSYGDEVVQSGLKNNLSYSLGQFHYQTNGFRKNNQLNEDLYTGFAQAKLLPNLSIQIEARHKESKFGDLGFNFDLNEPDSQINTKLRSDIVRIGSHYAPTSNVDVISSAIYMNDSQKDKSQGINQHDSGFLGESQAIFRHESFNVVAGGGYFDSSAKQGSNPYSERHGNAYVYSYIRFPKRFVWTLGASFDSFHGRFLSDEMYSPKIGLNWKITDNLSIRGTYFKGLKRPLLNDQTIEPTNIAGFNQLYDDFNGTETKRYGIAADYRINHSAFAGVEISRRILHVPGQGVGKVPREEHLYRAYAHWAPNENLAFNANYEFENFIDAGFSYTKTHIGIADMRYFHPSGFIARLQATYVNQSVLFSGHDGFILFDAGLSYRLPNRYGILSFQINNIFDQNFQYQGLDNRTAPIGDGQPRFSPIRTFSTQLTLSF